MKHSPPINAFSLIRWRGQIGDKCVEWLLAKNIETGLPPRDGLRLHPSDNRVELDRARHALELAAKGNRAVVVSSGDPGVFAMASAVFEAVEHGPAPWRGLDIRVLPGITAMLAAAAAAGAPLGHDFCAINLSDNLKPFDLVLRRVQLPVSCARMLISRPFAR